MNRPTDLAIATSWPAIIAIYAAGVLAACQAGKATIALAGVQQELGISLALAAWLISAFAMLGAVSGSGIGMLVDRIGARRMLIAGLAILGFASLAGSQAMQPASLLASRLIEGLGFLGVITSAPSLIVARASASQRTSAMALWSSFMPIGISIAMLAAPLLALIGWRQFWLVNGLLLLAYATGLALLLPAPVHNSSARRAILPDIKAALRAPGPRILATLFGLYTAIYFSLVGFLPSFLAQKAALSPGLVSVISAIAVGANAIGNLGGGYLLGRGVRPASLMRCGFAVMGLCALFIYALTPAFALVLSLICIAFSLVGGFVPVVIMANVASLAPQPQLLGATIGITMQGNNLGIVTGPALAGALANHFGWWAIALWIIFLALLALLPVMAFSHIRQSQARVL